jgi:hypothetical protein
MSRCEETVYVVHRIVGAAYLTSWEVLDDARRCVADALAAVAKAEAVAIAVDLAVFDCWLERRWPPNIWESSVQVPSLWRRGSNTSVVFVLRVPPTGK